MKKLIRRRKKTVKRKDPLYVDEKIARKLSQQLRWANNAKLWSKIYICYVVGAVTFVVGFAGLLQAEAINTVYGLGMATLELVGFGLLLAAGLCHYSRISLHKPLAQLFKELVIYGKQHNANVKVLRHTFKQSDDTFMQRMANRRLQENLRNNKNRWREIANFSYGLKDLPQLDERQLRSLRDLTLKIRAMGLKLLPEPEAKSPIQGKTQPSAA